MSKDIEIEEIGVDTEKATAMLRQLELHAEITAKTVMETTRKGYASLILLADIMGIAVPEWFNLMATSALMAGEMLITLATAETITGNPVLVAKTVITFSIATLIFIRAMQIQQQQSEIESKLNSTLQLLVLWGGR